MKGRAHALRRGLGGLLAVLAAWLLWRQLRALRMDDLQASLAAISPRALLLSVVATALSFACLAAYERLVTQWLAPGRVPRAVAWRTGLVAHALANTLGFHPVTAVALRLQRYRAHGVDAVLLGKMVVAIGGCVATGVLSILALAGAWSLWDSGRGVVLMLVALACAGAVVLLRTRLPGLWLRAGFPTRAGGIVALGLVEMAGAIAALAVLLPPGALPDGPRLVFLFVAAAVLGIASHAPGGIGVFEATILAAVAPAQRAPVLAALLAYRVVYNLLPCALGLLVLAVEVLRTRLSSTAGTRA